MKKISVLLPLKVKNNEQYKLFCRCLLCYSDLLKDSDTELIVANESINKFYNLTNQKLKEISPQVNFIETKGFVNSVRELIKSSKNKYIMFILDDVELLFDVKESIHDCVETMDKNEDIDQIKFGGGKIYKANRTQVKIFKKNHKPIKTNKNTIWLNDSLREDKRHLISYWNSLTRSSLLKELDLKYNKNCNTFDAYTVETSKIFVNMNKKDSKTGWLNLKCGLYAWGRTNNTFIKHKNKYDKNNW